MGSTTVTGSVTFADHVEYNYVFDLDSDTFQWFLSGDSHSQWSNAVRVECPLPGEQDQYYCYAISVAGCIVYTSSI